jgi:hypothetical protein
VSQIQARYQSIVSFMIPQVPTIFLFPPAQNSLIGTTGELRGLKKIEFAGCWLLAVGKFTV